MSNITSRFNEALAALNNRDLKRAEELFKSVIKIDALNVPALNLIVVVLMSMERFDEAEPFIEKATSLNQKSDASFYNYGLISKRLNKPRQALENFSKALALNPNVAETWNNRGTVFNDLKDYDLAIADFDKAILLNGLYGEAYANKGKSLTLLNRYDEASAAYDKALSIKPNLAGAWLGRGNIFAALRRYDEAFAAYDKALSIKRDLENAWLGCGDAFYSLRRYDEASAAYDKALSIKPGLAEAWLGRGNVFTDLKRYDEASAAYDKALSIKPDLAEAWLGRGNVLYSFKRYDEASAAYDRALSIKPDLAEAWLGRGNVFTDLKRYDEASAACDKALSIKPDLAEAWLGRGNVFTDLKRYDEASAAYDKALSIKPDLAEAWLGRGKVFTDLKRYDEASAACDKALSIKPDLAEAWLGRGNVFTVFKRYDEASAAYDRALSIKPDSAEAWLGRGNVLYSFKRYDEASAAYDKALSIKPDWANAWLSRGNVFDCKKKHDQALLAYSRVQQIDSDFEFIKGRIVHQKMLCGDWSNLNQLVAEIESDVFAGKTSAIPFGWQGISDSEQTLQLCARIWNKNNYPQPGARPMLRVVQHNDKIRLGYVSGEFREQATSHLIVGLLESHDKSKFEIYAFDNGWDDNSAIRKRINDSMHKLIDVSRLDDATVVKRIANEEIDILINLNGYFGEERTHVFAYKSAPIQVNYLGFPGTIGAPYIDYIIADKIVIPPTSQVFYDEKVIYLPHTYQPNDRQKAISEVKKSRQELELLENSIVFCCFNNTYKITPETFTSWMKILLRVENSVLWLVQDSEVAATNLRHFAQERGIDPSRIIFAKRMSLADHLARHRLADLFLDTLPHNAHTTASDALWAGLPVLTQIGTTFPGRVAASLLNAVGLPELITHSREQYEALAIELALNSEKLKAIKEKLARNRLTTPLFDTPLYTKHLEAAYEAMYQRHQAGLPPDQIEINA